VAPRAGFWAIRRWPLPAPKSLSPVPGIESEPLESWRLEPKHPDWARGQCGTWTPGKTAAQARLKRFLEHGVKPMRWSMADAGSNPANWQWVAGCGADATPYFRVFNPVCRARSSTPTAYVRRWVPELARLPQPLIQRPWSAAPLELRGAGVELGLLSRADNRPQARARARAGGLCEAAESLNQRASL
jgi:deoxyribodipyrimidine photolyase